MNNIQKQFMEAISLFGFTPQDFNFNGLLPSGANKRLATIKEETKKKYKELAKVHHPDVGGLTEDFQRLQFSYELIQKLQVQFIQPQPVVHYYYYNSYNATNSSTTNTW